MAEALAKFRRKGIDQNLAFTAGLVHDIGLAFIEKKMPEASDEIRLKMDLGRTQLDAEESVLGMNHAAIGAVILRQWSVPDIIIEAVRFHHAPWEVENVLCPIIALANQSANQTQENNLQIDEQLLTYCQLSPGDLSTLKSATQVSISAFEAKFAGS
jgi:putative nucleotidyltransferase with HDIG domain